jgi:hypothetical protein
MFLRFVFLVLILFIVVYPQNNISKINQVQESNVVVRPFTDITYEIAVPTQRILPLQPIPIIIRQKNTTNEQVLGYNAIGFDNLPIYIHLQKSGNTQRNIMGQFSQLSAFVAYTNVEIPPNSVSEAKDWMMLGLNKYFPEPGTYEIKAVVFNDNRTQSVESNTITIEIQEPTGANRNVYNLIKNSGVQEYLFSGDNFDQIKNTLEAITTRFPNSDYAKSSSFVLGEKLFARKQYGQALVHLLRLENDRDFIFADKVRNYLTEMRRLPQSQQINEEKPLLEKQFSR